MVTDDQVHEDGERARGEDKGARVDAFTACDQSARGVFVVHGRLVPGVLRGGALEDVAEGGADGVDDVEPDWVGMLVGYLEVWYCVMVVEISGRVGDLQTTCREYRIRLRWSFILNRNIMMEARIENINGWYKSWTAKFQRFERTCSSMDFFGMSLMW
jgi:hypothetical protein